MAITTPSNLFVLLRGNTRISGRSLRVRHPLFDWAAVFSDTCYPSAGRSAAFRSPNKNRARKHSFHTHPAWCFLARLEGFSSWALASVCR